MVPLMIFIPFIQGSRKIEWLEVFAGEKGVTKMGKALPKETVDTFSKYIVGIKGPLATPVSVSLN